MGGVDGDMGWNEGYENKEMVSGEEEMEGTWRNIM